MFKKLIINAALTGVIPTKEMTPHVPITPKEIAEDAFEVYKAGASIVHVHARDSQGIQTHKKEVYQEIVDRIRQKAPELIITVSTTGRNIQDFEQRSEVLDIDPAPDMASITLGSMNFMQGASLNSPEWIKYLLTRMNERNIKPEIEVFHDGMINYAKYLMKKKLLPKRNNYFNILLGNLGTTVADQEHLCHMAKEIPEYSTWAASGIGQFSETMMQIAIKFNGHVRVGIEDGIYMTSKKVELATNSNLVRRAKIEGEYWSRDIMSCKETRKLLNLRSI